MMKKTVTAVVLSLSAMSTNVALAHGSATARHGGVVATASDLGFELVGIPGGVAIYVDDHGKPMAPTGMTGKLTVLNGSARSEAELVAAGDKLEAKGSFKVGAGTKVLADVALNGKPAITARFTLK